MNASLSYRPLLFILLFFARFTVAAQDDATAKFIDSATQPAPAHNSVAAVTDTVIANDIDSTSAPEELPPVDTNITSRFKQINAGTVATIRKDKGFYYQHWLDSLLRADDSKLEVKKEPRNYHLPNLDLFFTIFKIVLWVLAAAILLFIIYRLFLGKSALFIRNSKNIDASIAIEKPLAADQYENMIQQAESANNYRLAVRYRHLQSTHLLAEKGYLTLGTEKTNYQYLNELRTRSPRAAKLFAALTVKYEYIWYGEYPVNDAMYSALRRDFTDFNSNIAQY